MANLAFIEPTIPFHPATAAAAVATLFYLVFLRIFIESYITLHTLYNMRKIIIIPSTLVGYYSRNLLVLIYSLTRTR